MVSFYKKHLTFQPDLLFSFQKYLLTSENLTELFSSSFFPRFFPIFSPCVDDFPRDFPHELASSQEDSLSSCRGLMPKPPRRDEQKLLVDADKAGVEVHDFMTCYDDSYHSSMFFFFFFFF